MTKSIIKKRVKTLPTSFEISSLLRLPSSSVNIGTKAGVRAPSPTSLLRKLAILKATKEGVCRRPRAEIVGDNGVSHIAEDPA